MRNDSMLCLIAVSLAVCSNTVYGAVAKVAATTTIIEKEVAATVAPSYTNAAIVNLTPIGSDFISGYNVQILSLHKIHWVVDETFYATGYKALLNKNVKELIAPPRS